MSMTKTRNEWPSRRPVSSCGLGSWQLARKGDRAGRGKGNSRIGYTDKTAPTEDGEMALAVPRDRNGSFEPVIVPKGNKPSGAFVPPVDNSGTDVQL